MGLPLSDDCHGRRDLISRSADGELSPTDHAKLRAHLAVCASCAAEARVSLELTGLLKRDPLPLTEARLPSGLELARTVREAAAVERRWPELKPWGWGGALAAAAALVIILGRSPSSPVTSPPTPSAAVTQETPGFWIVDDERTGRDVLIGPAVSYTNPQ